MGKNRLMYSIGEAASLLGISKSKAYECARTGELRTVRLGGRIVVPEAALAELVERSGGDPRWADTDGSHLNEVTISGRLTRDAELRTARSGAEFTVMRLAVRKRPSDEVAIFVDIVAFGDLTRRSAELRKGQAVKVTGRLDQREWTTEDGTRRESHQVVVSGLELLDQPRSAAS